MRHLAFQTNNDGLILIPHASIEPMLAVILWGTRPGVRQLGCLLSSNI